MSGTLSDIDSTSPLAQLVASGSYKMHAPNVRAYDPSTLEQVYGTALSKDLGANYNFGLLNAASLDRQAQAANYNEELRAANAYQLRAAQSKSAADVAGARYKLLQTALEHPNQAYAFTDTRSLLAPDMQQHGANLAGAGLAKTQSEAFENYGQGYQAAREAGLQMPVGATADHLGRPSAPLAQGTPLDLETERVSAAAKVAAGGSQLAAAKLQHVTGANNMMDDLDKEHATLLGQYHQEVMKQTIPEVDNRGRVIKAAPLTTDQALERINAYRSTLDADRTARYERIAKRYGAGGHGYIAPDVGYRMAPPPAAGGTSGTVQHPGAAPATGDRPTPANAATTERRDERPVLGVGGPTGNQPAPTARANLPGPNAGQRVAEGDQMLAALRTAGVPNAESAARRAMTEQRKYGPNIGYRITSDGTVIFGNRERGEVGRMQLR